MALPITGRRPWLCSWLVAALATSIATSITTPLATSLATSLAAYCQTLESIAAGKGQQQRRQQQQSTRRSKCVFTFHRRCITNGRCLVASSRRQGGDAADGFSLTHAAASRHCAASRLSVFLSEIILALQPSAALFDLPTTPKGHAAHPAHIVAAFASFVTIIPSHLRLFCLPCLIRTPARAIPVAGAALAAGTSGQ